MKKIYNNLPVHYTKGTKKIIILKMIKFNYFIHYSFYHFDVIFLYSLHSTYFNY